MEDPHPPPRILPPSRSGSGRRSCGDANSSPEFEFWMVRNPSLPPPNLLSADELFSGGVLLPLHNLSLAPPREADADRDPEPEPESESSAAELTANSALTSSKRWRDIFRKSEKKSGEEAQSVKEKENRRREKKNGGSAGGAASSAELNINIWPFSRSRSAGNGGNRPRAAAIRKVSSAPCSRSNSRGESKSRKPPTSPGRGGVHLGRSSPVWQVRRGGGGGEKKRSEGIENRRRVPIAGGAKARVLSLNVPVCMGYRQHFSCKSNEITGGGGGAVAGGEGTRGSGSNLFNIRSIFTKKVY